MTGPTHVTVDAVSRLGSITVLIELTAAEWTAFTDHLRTMHALDLSERVEALLRDTVNQWHEMADFTATHGSC